MMGITDKIAAAKKTNWVSEGISEAELKTTVELAKISAKIERCRLEKGMTQKEFANYMGVTQGMVSKWESRDYNFTIRTLNEICQKIDLTLSVNLEKPCPKNDYIVIKWDEERVNRNDKKNDWMNHLDVKGAIA
jgi:transcriptional regulator with XRE-family HTH domain